MSASARCQVQDMIELPATKGSDMPGIVFAARGNHSVFCIFYLLLSDIESTYEVVEGAIVSREVVVVEVGA
jgi:hypothetical protein